MGYGFHQTGHPPHPAAEADGGGKHALQGNSVHVTILKMIDHCIPREG